MKLKYLSTYFGALFKYKEPLYCTYTSTSADTFIFVVSFLFAFFLMALGTVYILYRADFENNMSFLNFIL